MPTTARNIPIEASDAVEVCYACDRFIRPGERWTRNRQGRARHIRCPNPEVWEDPVCPRCNKVIYRYEPRFRDRWGRLGHQACAVG